MSTAESTRNRLLDAANRHVHVNGSKRLTLEAVAKEAGMSKGALLYHFPNKDALVRAMVARHITDFEDAVRDQAQPAETGADWLRAYIECCFDSEVSNQKGSSSVLAAAANNLELLEALRERSAVWQNTIETDAADPSLATLLRLAADGLWYADLLDLNPLSAEQREKVRQTAVEFSKQAAGQPE